MEFLQEEGVSRCVDDIMSEVESCGGDGDGQLLKTWTDFNGLL